MIKMSTPFVKIIENKLTLVGDVPQGNPRVISILGKARMGKSTFLNAIVSHIRKQSQAPFKAVYGDDHCTRGIDSYFLPDHNLLLLDSQGLDYEDASHDPHLLLLLYIISDVIIFNDRSRLENGALKLMEPVCTFTNYLDIKSVVKPKLHFRISDSDIQDAAKNLEKVLGTYEDQYQSIRNSIKHLFDKDLRLLKTEPLDRPARMMLENNMYSELLNEPLGFREAVSSILSAANTITSKSALTQLPDIIQQINSNEEISIEKLDVVKLQAENDIHKWVQTQVPDIVYTSIEVDGTQKCFDTFVEPRKNMKKNQLATFTKRFRDVEETIRGPFYKTLNSKMDAPIQKAIEESRSKARAMYADQLKQLQTDRVFPSVNSLKNSFGTIPPTYWTNYLQPFIDLEDKIAVLYEPVSKEIGSWLCEIYDVVNKTVDTIKMEEQRQAVAVETLLQEEAKSMERYLLMSVENFVTTETLLRKNTDILVDLYQEKLYELKQAMITLTTRHTVSFQLEKGTLVAKVIEGNVTSGIEEYDLVKDMYAKFLVTLYDYMTTPTSPACMKLIEAKKGLLYNKLFPKKDHPWTTQLVVANPEITFVHDSISQEISDNPLYSIMTLDTQTDTYRALYARVFEILVAKGYCSTEKAATMIVTSTIKDDDLTERIHFRTSKSVFSKHLIHLFTMRLRKEYCKGITTKKVFPTEIEEELMEDISIKKCKVHFTS